MALIYDELARHATIDNLTTDYVELTWLVARQGRPVAPRGQKTREIEDFSLTLTDPMISVPVGVGRKLSQKILAAEALQWIGGFSDLAQLASVSRGRFDDFSDDGITLYGAYGPRTFAGLERAIGVLEVDRDSRQAVVPVWRPVESTRTKDLPCTLSWSFRIRNGELHMTTNMRSNDVLTGVAYDIPSMCRIGDAVAFALGLPFTEYHHTAQSFHVYERDLEAVSNLTATDVPVAQPPMFTQGLAEWFDEAVSFHQTPSDVWTIITALAANASGHHHHDSTLNLIKAPLPDGFQHFADVLAGSTTHRYFCRQCRYYIPTFDDHTCSARAS